MTDVYPLAIDGQKYTAVELAKQCAVTAGTIRRWAKEYADFPKATVIYVGFQPTQYWSLDEINNWLQIRRDKKLCGIRQGL